MIQAITTIALVLAMICAGWYRSQVKALLESELTLVNYLTEVILNDDEQKRQRDSIWNELPSLINLSTSELVAHTSIRLLEVAKSRFGNSRGRRDIAAMLLSIAHR